MHQLFRLWLGVTEYLFRKPLLLEEVIETAIEDDTFRSDDLEFTFAARVSHIVIFLCVIRALWSRLYLLCSSDAEWPRVSFNGVFIHDRCPRH